MKQYNLFKGATSEMKTLSANINQEKVIGIITQNSQQDMIQIIPRPIEISINMYR